MSRIEKLIAEDEAIREARSRLLKREMRLMEKLQGHRGEVALVDGVVYAISYDDDPKIRYVGELVE